MDEVLQPSEDVLAALAAQMGLQGPAVSEPRKSPDAAASAAAVQKSYSQLT